MLRRLDPRLRIIAALAFALAVIQLQRPAPLLLALGLAALLVAAGNAADPAQGPGPASLWRRLLGLEAFMLVLLLTLPFSVDGRALLALGPWTASVEGLALALVILLRANAVLLAGTALLLPLGAAGLAQGLTRLGLPGALAQLLLLTVRQIDLTRDELLRLRQAMRARAFTPRADRHTWRSLGWLMGMLLVRSAARGERLGEAMRCRGFDGRLRLLEYPPWRPADSVVLMLWLGLLAALFWLDRVAAPAWP